MKPGNVPPRCQLQCLAEGAAELSYIIQQGPSLPAINNNSNKHTVRGKALRGGGKSIKNLHKDRIVLKNQRNEEDKNLSQGKKRHSGSASPHPSTPASACLSLCVSVSLSVSTGLGMKRKKLPGTSAALQHAKGWGWGGRAGGDISIAPQEEIKENRFPYKGWGGEAGIHPAISISTSEKAERERERGEEHYKGARGGEGPGVWRQLRGARTPTSPTLALGQQHPFLPVTPAGPGGGRAGRKEGLRGPAAGCRREGARH